MNSFSIRDIENLCGIKAHTLRIWEQRYGSLISPKRKASMHRQYDNEDLKYLLRIAYLYHTGYKISKIALLTEQEICSIATRVSTGAAGDEIFITQLAEASIDFDQEKFDKILHHSVLHFGLEKTMMQVVFPFLRKIGMLWVTGNIVPAQEHFASNLIIKKLCVAINGLEKPPAGTKRNVLIFGPTEELHELPLLFMKYLLKKNNTHTVYFGTNTSEEEIKAYCSQWEVTHLYCHVITNLTRCEPDEYIQKIVKSFPGKQIVVSGCITKEIRGSYPALRLLHSMEDMIDFAKQ